jgi:DNA polymerase elongation subunit (family B)
VERWDPDVIEGHNIFNFDLPYIARRAQMHSVALSLGRDGSLPRRRPSRVSYGERTIAYERWQIAGRHIVDTLFLVHAYDVSHRSLSGFGLKEVALHFGLAPRKRTYIAGNRITATFRKDPDKVLRYVKDDIVETRALGELLSKSHFFQAQMLPYSYQTVCVRGMATKIDALMIREYCRRRSAVAIPGRAKSFEGGYTDMFETGVIRNVHHCDVRSLYPSLMLLHELGPADDRLGVFLGMLRELRDFRVRVKRDMEASTDPAQRIDLDALQSAFKIFINSFYGYLGFSQGRFNDYDVAAAVTERGRSLLRAMIEWLREQKARPVEIDTDGIYFVPPGEADDELDVEAQQSFRSAFQAFLPKGITIEFDGEYTSMYSYKMKNYALLSPEGEITIKGAALRSRGLAPFQRSFLREIIRRRLMGKDDELPELRAQYEAAIRKQEWPITELARTERLQDAPATYAAKREKGKRAKSAVYELALASGKEYRAGDQLSYYVTGNRKSVAVHEAARLVSDWNPRKRDENVPYYLAKLESLWEKFGHDNTQGIPAL